jgi:hypothetical protein
MNEFILENLNILALLICMLASGAILLINIYCAIKIHEWYTVKGILKVNPQESIDSETSPDIDNITIIEGWHYV